MQETFTYDDMNRLTGDGNNSTSYWRTFVTGPYGVFAVVVTLSGINENENKPYKSTQL